MNDEIRNKEKLKYFNFTINDTNILNELENE